MLVKAIRELGYKGTFSFIEDAIEATYKTNSFSFSLEDLEAKVKELEAEYEATQYQRDRANEYPSIVDQLDDIYHNGIDGWKATIKATKDKYPKP